MSEVLITEERTKNDPRSEFNQGIELGLDSEIAFRLFNKRFGRELYDELQGRARDIIREFGVPLSNRSYPLVFQRERSEKSQRFYGLLSQCSIPRRGMSLLVVPRDYNRLSLPEYNGRVRYRSVGTSSEEHLDQLKRLYEEAWLNPILEALDIPDIE